MTAGTTTVNLGGETHTISVSPCLQALNAAWPAMKALAEGSLDMVPRAMSAATVVGSVMAHDAGKPEWSAPAIMKLVRGMDEMEHLISVAREIMFGSGLFERPGEAKPPVADVAPAAETPEASTATSSP